MQTSCGSWMRACKRDKINILCSPTHERFESVFGEIDANFYAIKTPETKDWNQQYSRQPDNYHIYNSTHLPYHVKFDLVLSQNKFGQFQYLARIARIMGLPLVSIEHTCPMPFWSQDQMKQLRQMEANINVFISDWSVDAWGFSDSRNVRVVEHCVDTNTFSPSSFKRTNQILTVANDYIGRDYCLNFKQYMRITQGLKTMPVGDTPNFSKPSKDINELVNFYRTSRVFLNTAHLSPIPTSLLEAMSCECAVVSCKTCAIPSYIKHGETGFLYETDQEARYYLELLMKDEKLATRIGKNARQSILKKCSKNRFVNEYNKIFQETILT